MRTAGDIYAEYRIMPSLQLHQLHVAAVGKLVCDHFTQEIDTNAVVLACLFHDMGNIIKFDLEVFPQFREPEGIGYWQKIKDEWVAKYGKDEHAATKEIAHEIGLPEAVCTLIDETRFSRIEAARDSGSFEGKVVKYSDMRVAPFGIVSMMERLEDGRERYAKKNGYDTPEGREQYRVSIEAAADIERQIFAQCSIRPEDINDVSAEPLLEELRNYPVA